MAVSVRNLKKHAGETVAVRGWLAGKELRTGQEAPADGDEESAAGDEESAALRLRDGSGYVTAAVRRGDVSEEAWQAVLDVCPESTVRVTGIARLEESSPDGLEIRTTDFAVRHASAGFPADDGGDAASFMERRHLALRSPRQRAILKVRHEVCQALRDFFYEREFVLVDAPILTPTSCEDASTLFETMHLGQRAYLAQSGQLYLEPACAAFGKVYCMGPVFRAETVSSPHHLNEFWMVESEVAFLDFEGMLRLAEKLVCYLVARVLDRCGDDLAELERDVTKLEKITSGFPQITYAEALEHLKERGRSLEWGEDLSDDDETLLTEIHDGPVFVTRLPAALRAFYAQPAPEDDRLVLGADLLAPEGFGEIVGGSERIHDHDRLLRRLLEHELPVEPFQWYLDLRRYGSFPHSGFGLGVERFVAWMGGVPHVRETIPFPRTRQPIYP